MKHREPFAIDPEVLADLQLREHTERTRRTKPVDAIYAYKPPEFVGAWRCRRCGVLVEIQASDLENLAMWNRVLKARGEAPIDNTKIALCDECKAVEDDRRSDGRKEQAGIVNDLIRSLKATDDIDGIDARAQTKRLRELGHPDVDGLLHELRERAGARAAKRARVSAPKPKLVDEGGEL